MREISKKDLEDVIRLSIRFYNEDNAYQGDLDAKQFNAQCFLKACVIVLKTPGEFTFPKRQDTTGFGDSDG